MEFSWKGIYLECSKVLRCVHHFTVIHQKILCCKINTVSGFQIYLGPIQLYTELTLLKFIQIFVLLMFPFLLDPVKGSICEVS